MFERLMYYLSTDGTLRNADKYAYKAECDKLAQLETEKDVAWRDYERTKVRHGGFQLPMCFQGDATGRCVNLVNGCDVNKRLECKNAFHYIEYKKAAKRFYDQEEVVAQFWQWRYLMRTR